MKSTNPVLRTLNPVMMFLAPGAGAVGLGYALTLLTPLAAWQCWAIGIPAGIVAGWIFSILVLSSMTLLSWWRI